MKPKRKKESNLETIENGEKNKECIAEEAI